MSEAPCVLEVAVAAPLMGTFDYLPVPGDPGPYRPGQRLRVPFGRSRRVGILIRVRPEHEHPSRPLRAALERLDTDPLLPPDLQRLVNWASGYYQHPIGEVFATTLPKALREGNPAATGEVHIGLTGSGREIRPSEVARAPRQAAILTFLQAAGEDVPVGRLTSVCAGWSPVVRRLVARGWVRTVHGPAVPDPVTGPADTPPIPTPDQALAVERILAGPGYACHLLDGVTGSGKTEVYLRCIQRVLDQGGQSLVLVPEIALTPQLIDRFRRRFRLPVAELHSGLSDGERLRAWTAARDGSAALIVGTRSAVFTPLRRPGLLVVDEEHDASFKQQEGFRYSARDLAVWRARALNVPIVLGSATPSLESLENVRAGRYQRLELPVRAGAAGAPRVHVVDIRRHPLGGGLSAPLLAAVRRHLDAGGQALLYLNRRGFAPALICPGCGLTVDCTRCDARMVLHQHRHRLVCHHCGAERRAPEHCADCGEALQPIGQGTERLEQALAGAFPAEEIVRIDRDTTRRKGEVGRRLDRIRSVDARLLMGTQMVTKGHDFPRVTLVGIVDADQGLFGTDFRSAERLAQTIVQVAGRAGRAEHPGEVYLQTLFPEHPLLRLLLSRGYGEFARAALEERRRTGWPPYAFLALLRAEAVRRDRVFGFLQAAAGLVGSGPAGSGLPAGVRLLGPAPAPMERRSGRYRGQVLVHATGRGELQRFLPGWRAAVAALPSARHIRWSLDVDPVELF